MGSVGEAGPSWMDDDRNLHALGRLEECICDLTATLRELAAGVRHPPVGECLLTAEELGERFRLSPRTLKDQAAAGLIPHHRFGKHYRFAPDDIAEILRITRQVPRQRRTRAARTARPVERGDSRGVRRETSRQVARPLPASGRDVWFNIGPPNKESGPPGRRGRGVPYPQQHVDRSTRRGHTVQQLRRKLVRLRKVPPRSHDGGQVPKLSRQAAPAAVAAVAK
jgi:excisionase family DNA binding protein